MQVLDNEYSNYIGIVTGFDYKNILQNIKLNSTKKTNNFENLDDIEEHHQCNDTNCNHNTEEQSEKEL